MGVINFVLCTKSHILRIKEKNNREFWGIIWHGLYLSLSLFCTVCTHKMLLLFELVFLFQLLLK